MTRSFWRKRLRINLKTEKRFWKEPHSEDVEEKNATQDDQEADRTTMLVSRSRENNNKKNSVSAKMKLKNSVY